MTNSRRLVIVGALVLLAMPAAGQDVASQADGAALFKTYCAMCHDGPAADAQATRLHTLRGRSGARGPPSEAAPSVGRWRRTCRANHWRLLTLQCRNPHSAA